jgi:hypothetical protein
MTIYVCMDDTDNLHSRGTGRLARVVAAEIARSYPVRGVTRHQLYFHPDIPYTSHNSCAVLHVEVDEKEFVDEIFRIAKQEMLNDFVEGSDPGLAVAHDSQILPPLVAYGRDAKDTVLNQGKSRTLARNLGIKLEGLGGTEDGVIGAMAGLGLAFTQNDGRFLQIGKIRQLTGTQSVDELLGAGIDAVFTMDGFPVNEGNVFNEEGKSVKPCPVNGKSILFVEVGKDGVLRAIKRN